MKDYYGRVKRLELKAGTALESSYSFCHIVIFCPIEDYIKHGEICFRNNDFAGVVAITAKQGNKVRSVDVNSAEGIRVLKTKAMN